MRRSVYCDPANPRLKDVSAERFRLTPEMPNPNPTRDSVPGNFNFFPYVVRMPIRLRCQFDGIKIFARSEPAAEQKRQRAFLALREVSLGIPRQDRNSVGPQLRLYGLTVQ